MSSQHPASSRSIHRIIILSTIVFFVSRQFSHLKHLFDSNSDDVDTDVGWAPEGFGAPKPKPKGGQRRPRTESERNQTKIEDKGKRRRMLESRRFRAANYSTDFEPLPWTLPEPTPMRYQTSEEFMADYIAEKRKNKIPLPWEQQHKYADKAVTLPLPIISLNFPKSATLTMKTFFDCGGITSSHTSTQDGRIAVCMMENQLNDKPPMDGCNTHTIRTRKANTPREDGGETVPIDFFSDIGIQGPPCYYAGVHDGGLENIAKHYPDATILLVTRNATSWHRSMVKWGSIMVRLKRHCAFDGELHSGENMNYWSNMYRSMSNSREMYWANFYQAHTQKIREFAMKHLSMTYVEVELENEKMGEILEKYTSVSASCVMDCHPGPNWVTKNNATSKCHPVGENPALNNSNPDIDNEEDGDDEDNDNMEEGGDIVENDDIEDEASEESQ